MSIEFGIVGGTGVYDPKILQGVKGIEVNTPYGKVNLISGEIFGKQAAFLARHGEKHTVPPHLVNYRANIWALRELGVKKVIATAAVGSLEHGIRPGEFVLPDQFLDFTKNRVSTFYTGEQGVLHVDVTDPYCSELRSTLVEQAAQMGIKIKNGATYVCTEGPRFETPAEIKMYGILGGQLVGMTSVPEVVLARELGMCYAAIAMITNYAAGISPAVLTHQEVVENMASMSEKLRRLVAETIQALSPKQTCACFSAAEELGKF